MLEEIAAGQKPERSISENDFRSKLEALFVNIIEHDFLRIEIGEGGRLHRNRQNADRHEQRAKKREKDTGKFWKNAGAGRILPGG